MKLLKLTVSVILLATLFAIIGLIGWLCNPLDKTAWRVPIVFPIMGLVKVRAWPLIQTVTSPQARILLNHSLWPNKQGLLKLEYNAALTQIICFKCQLNLAALTSNSIQFDKASLSFFRVNNQLTGTLTTISAGKPVQMPFTAHANMQGLDIDWLLPKTAIADLLTPLKSHSETIQKAQVTGTLSADGNLQWPSKIWNAHPVIESFDVTGLDTENLKAAEIKYQCPHPNKKANNIATNSQIWLAKENIGIWLPKAVLIAEDAKFMHHHGYDLEILNYLLSQKKPNKQLGGSTISQQLAKYFFTGGKRQWKRKVEELLYAVEMEKNLGKERILNIYLNTLDWGPGICGAYDAAQYYFAVNPIELSAVQAVWLAGIIRNPHRAWQTQYLTNKPDLKRVQEIMRFMPAKARNLPLTLNFSKQ